MFKICKLVIPKSRIPVERFQKFQISTGKMPLKYLNQSEAIQIDKDLFEEFRFSVDQLMELAGQSCAVAIAKVLSDKQKTDSRILVCCGPGNNGGDGLVCARHLRLFGYGADVYYPKRTANRLYENLLHQCLENDVTLVQSVDEIRSNLETGSRSYSMLVDALFGFSFKPPVRSEFRGIVDLLLEVGGTGRVPICSVDIPSGWHVEQGPIEPEGSIQPEILVSLTAPKLCAKKFRGKWHFLGGRFVPKKLENRYGLGLPEYPGTELVVLLENGKE